MANNNDLHEPLLQLIVATQQLSPAERDKEVKRMLDTINDRVAANTRAQTEEFHQRKRFAFFEVLLRYIGMTLFGLSLNWIRLQFEGGKLTGTEVGSILSNLVLGLGVIVGASALLAWTSKMSGQNPS